MQNTMRVTADGRMIKKGTKLYANQDKYEGEFVDMMKHGNGILSFANGDRYLGEFERDQFHGQGVYSYAPFLEPFTNFQNVGKRYEGGWRNNKMHGIGMFLLGNGDHYAGMFEGGLYSGPGKLFVKKIEFGENAYDKYDGIWKGGKPNGKMKIAYANGDRFEGNTYIGKFHGKGKMEYKNDLGSYEGDWLFGLCHGKGTRVFSNGSKYIGSMFEGEMHGEGIMFFANSDQYVGMWYRGYMSGRGVIRYANGERYEGEFRYGVFYGEGKYTFADGGFYEGEYKNIRSNPVTFLEFPYYDNLRHGFGQRVWTSGNKYQGQWRVGHMDGQGVYTTIMGETYKGNYMKSMKHGTGREEFGNVFGQHFICPLNHRHKGQGFCVYEGEYKLNFFHGKGKLTCFDGRYYEGDWIKGKKHGSGKEYYLIAGDLGDPDRLYIGGQLSLTRHKMYKGMWRMGVKHGDGQLFWTNGDYLEGTFVDGQPHGYIFNYFASGRRRLSEYVRGDRIAWRDNALAEGIKVVKYLNRSTDFKKSLLAIDQGGSKDAEGLLGSNNSKKSTTESNNKKSSNKDTNNNSKTANVKDKEKEKEKDEKEKDRDVKLSGSAYDLSTRAKPDPNRLPTPGSRIKDSQPIKDGFYNK